MGFLGDLFGGNQAKAAKEAARIQARTARENRELGKEFVATSLDDLDAALASALGETETAADAYQPFSEAGTGALSQLAALYGLEGPEAARAAMEGFTESPGYQFRLNEGISAIDRSAAARGGLYSGRTGRELTRYGQGVASDEFGRYVGGLSGLADMGYDSAGRLSNIALGRGDLRYGAGMDKARTRLGGLSAITGANTQIGQAQAGGVLGAAAAKAAGANNLLKIGTTAAKIATGMPF